MRPPAGRTREGPRLRASCRRHSRFGQLRRPSNGRRRRRAGRSQLRRLRRDRWCNREASNARGDPCRSFRRGREAQRMHVETCAREIRQERFRPHPGAHTNAVHEEMSKGRLFSTLSSSAKDFKCHGCPAERSKVGAPQWSFSRVFCRSSTNGKAQGVACFSVFAAAVAHGRGAGPRGPIGQRACRSCRASTLAHAMVPSVPVCARVPDRPVRDQ